MTAATPRTPESTLPIYRRRPEMRRALITSAEEAGFRCVAVHKCDCNTTLAIVTSDRQVLLYKRGNKVDGVRQFTFFGPFARTRVRCRRCGILYVIDADGFYRARARRPS